MTLRRKGLRRVAMLMVILVILGSIGAVVAYKHRRTHLNQLEADRKQGIQAAQVGDYSKAIDSLEKVLNERPEDNDAAYYYAMSRCRIEEPRGQHIRKAVERLEDILKRDSEHLQAKYLLLDLYTQAANTEEQIEKLSNSILVKNPKDTIAIRGLITVDRRRHNFEQALARAKSYAELRPDDLQTRLLVMQWMHDLRKPNNDIQQYADAQFTSNTDDARYLLLQAYAANHVNNDQKARELLHKAASKQLNDPIVVKLLSSLFDQLKNFRESQDVLQSAVNQNGDPELTKLLAIRLWQFGKNDQIIELLSKTNPSNRKTDVDLIAILALARYEQSQADQATKLIEILKSHKETPRSAAWVLALQARYESASNTPLATSQVLRKALTKYPDNAVINAWLGDTYWTLGEASLAIHYWNYAAANMPSWAKPYIGMSQALLQLGRVSKAMDAAREAYDRLPNAASTINLAMVRFRVVEETADQKGAIELLALVDNIQKSIPNEPSTLPIKVSLLARTDQRQAAIELLNSILKNNSPLDPELAIRLSAVSRAEGLDLEKPILQSVAEEKVTPRVALTIAILSADSGKPQDGLAYLKSRLEKISARSRDWELVYAQYLDAINSPAAPDTWRKLGDAYQDSIDVQHTILASAHDLRSDRSYIEKTINRLKDLTGNDAERWKIERARWLIESQDVMKDAVEAVTILTDVVRNSPYQIEPRLQLAKALERTGNKISAIEHLREAQKIDPRSASVTLELVRLLQNQGSTDQVRVVLRQLSDTALTTAYQRVLLAAMFADVGENQRAFDLLIPDEKRSILSPAGRLLLAELYRKNQQMQQAKTLYDSLLESPNPSIGAIAESAQFYAESGELPKARQILARLGTLGDQNIETTIAMARFEEKFGDQEQALKLFRKAADSRTEQGFLSLIDHLVAKKDYPQVIAVARDAQQKLPGSDAITNRLLEAEARSLLKTDPNNVQPLIAALMRDPNRTAEVEVLTAIDQIRSNKLTGGEAISKLRTIADKYPRLLSLQEQLINLYLQNRKVDDAVLIAQRTMESMPTEPQAAMIAVGTFRTAGRWGEMRLAAEQWKQRDSTVQADADVAIAEALIELKKFAEARKQIEPHIAAITEDIRQQPHAGTVLARLMIIDKQVNQAQTLLEPLLKDAPGRKLWINLAMLPDMDHQQADSWMDKVSKAIPNGNLDESLFLLSRWTDLCRQAADLHRISDIAVKLEKYVEARPKDIDGLLLLEGIHQQQGQNDQAEKKLRAILEINPNHPAACNDLAYLLLQKPDSDSAEIEKLAKRAVQNAPNNAAFLDTLARIHMNSQHLDLAKTCFENALKLDPELLDARIGLARLLKEMGDSTSALRELRRVDQQLLSDPEAANRLKREVETLRQSLSRTDP